MNNPYYDMSVPIFIKQLTNLKEILEKARLFAEERKVAENVILESRLYADMFPLIRQIQIACDNAKNSTARLAGVEFPKMEDNEQSFAELGARIDATIAYLSTFKPEQFSDAATAEIRLPYFPGKHFVGADFLPLYALPNFYFHVATAYGIVRHVGVTIGKVDYIAGTPMYDDVA
jgi:hypothetical protein